jgi:hypothetical protein
MFFSFSCMDTWSPSLIWYREKKKEIELGDRPALFLRKAFGLFPVPVQTPSLVVLFQRTMLYEIFFSRQHYRLDYLAHVEAYMDIRASYLSMCTCFVT